MIGFMLVRLTEIYIQGVQINMEIDWFSIKLINVFFSKIIRFCLFMFIYWFTLVLVVLLCTAIYFMYLQKCFTTLYYMFFIFMTEIISRTDEGQPRPKYIFNRMWSYNIYTFFYSTSRFGPDHHHRILKFIILIFQNNNYKSVII